MTRLNSGLNDRQKKTRRRLCNPFQRLQEIKGSQDSLWIPANPHFPTPPEISFEVTSVFPLLPKSSVRMSSRSMSMAQAISHMGLKCPGKLSESQTWKHKCPSAVFLADHAVPLKLTVSLLISVATDHYDVSDCGALRCSQLTGPRA